MKQNYFLLVLLLSIISSTTYSQTIKISNVKYSGGSAISGGAIEIPQGGSVKINFTVEYNTGGIDYGGSANIGIMMPGSSMISSVLGTMAISPRYQGSQTFTNKTLSASNYPDGSTLLAEMSIPNYGTTKSNKIPIKIKYKNIENNTITGTQSVGNGTTPNRLTGSTPSGGNGKYEYQWQYSTGGGWQNISSKGTGKDYQPPILKKTTKYRRVVTSGNAEKSISNEVIITFVSINNSIVESKSAFYGERILIAGNDATGAEGSPSYKWQEKQGSDWKNIRNTSKDYSLIVKNNHQFRRLAIFGDITSTSNTTTITVKYMDPIKNNTISGNQTINYNTIPAILTGSTPIGGDGNYRYQWQEKPLGEENWMSVGSAQKNHQPSNLKITTQYRRRVISTGAKEHYSNIITVVVNQPTNIITNNTISGTQTVNVYEIPSIINGSNPKGGNGVYTYQWQRGLEGRFKNIESATSKDYQPPSNSAPIIYQYRRAVYSDNAERSTSNTVTIKIVDPYPIENNTISGDQTIKENEKPAIITGSTPNGGSGSLSYQWETATPPRQGSVPRWKFINNATSKNFQPPSLTRTTLYKRRVYDEKTRVSKSNTVTITVSNNIKRISPDIASKSTIELPNINSSFQIYPNPSTNGIINLSYEIGETSLPKAKVAIYSGSSGQKLYDKDVKITNSKIQTEINIPNYRSNDIYIVKFHIGNETITKRVILK